MRKTCDSGDSEAQGKPRWSPTKHTCRIANILVSDDDVHRAFLERGLSTKDPHKLKEESAADKCWRLLANAFNDTSRFNEILVHLLADSDKVEVEALKSDRGKKASWSLYKQRCLGGEHARVRWHTICVASWMKQSCS